ncbi:MAG TPA: TauD/TfdA family dioxygenase [Gammaproteobacteria bacterium]|nr:TauD/TfdA family dioxygenase [Gammaproteobacteria bacterium]
MNAVLNHCEENSPYLLANEAAYQDWRSSKLENRGQATPLRVFTLNAQGLLAESQLAAAQQQVEAYNFVIFEVPARDFSKHDFVTLNRQFGLHDLDNNLGADADKVTSLRVVNEADQRAQYIPYTNRAMNWHTDGYYNPHARRINAFSLYCVNQSARGGGNFLFDHEMMYLLIRDQSPELLEALMRDDLMRIPANVQDNQVIRAEETGPVFALQPITCALNMRFTSRPHNIVWKSDKCSQQALNLVREILMQGEAMIEIRLRAGQGIVCNNILHGREAFQDDPQHPARLIYRARYYDAIDFARGLGARSTV